MSPHEPARTVATAKHALLTRVIYEWDAPGRRYRIVESDDGTLGWEVEPPGVSLSDVRWDFLHAIAALVRSSNHPAERRADIANQRSQLTVAGLLDEFEAHLGCDLVEWLADALVAARAKGARHRNPTQEELT